MFDSKWSTGNTVIAVAKWDTVITTKLKAHVQVLTDPFVSVSILLACDLRGWVFVVNAYKRKNGSFYSFMGISQGPFDTTTSSGPTFWCMGWLGAPTGCLGCSDNNWRVNLIQLLTKITFLWNMNKSLIKFNTLDYEKVS